MRERDAETLPDEFDDLSLPVFGDGCRIPALRPQPGRVPPILGPTHVTCRCGRTLLVKGGEFMCFTGVENGLEVFGDGFAVITSFFVVGLFFFLSGTFEGGGGGCSLSLSEELLFMLRYYERCGHCS